MSEFSVKWVQSNQFISKSFKAGGPAEKGREVKLAEIR
jgi:hypothetical protein